MGGEFGQEREWNHDASLDWHLLDDPAACRRAGPGARPEPALSRRPGTASARLRAGRLRLDRRRQRRPRACCPSCASMPAGATGWRSSSAISRRCRGTTTGSACRARAAMSSGSTPMPASMAAAASAIAAAVESRARAHARPRAFARPAPAAARRPDPRPRSVHEPGPWPRRRTIRRRLLPGRPYPLGATWDGKGVNFALFSAHAEKVELCLFDRSGGREEARIVAARIHRRGVALLSARSAPGPALRLSRLRPVRSRGRPSLQPATSC